MMKKTKYLSYILLVMLLVACKKPPKSNPEPKPEVEPKDPEVASTIGFFLNDWKPKTFVAPAFETASLPTGATVFVTVNPSDIITKVPSALFGNNANPYMSQMVTEPALLSYITHLQPNIIRYPGGNISSIFFWNAEKGTRPTDVPDSLVDANGRKYKEYYWAGKNDDSWTLSVDNYYKMLQQTGNSGMITINYGYARYGTGPNPVAQAAHLAADWVRYDNGRTKYWEIGNESAGTWQAGYRIDVSKNKDGQPEIVSGELYGRHFKVFVDSMRKAAQEINKTIYIGAQLIQEDPPSWASPVDKNWNSGVFSTAANTPDFYIFHSYYTPYQQNSGAADILASASAETAKMMQWLKTTTQRGGVQLKPIALTEWNIFAEGSMQQVSHINGLHADLVLGELLKNKYGMAARWDLANGWNNGNDHGMFNIGDEPGAQKWNPRPVFYHMYYFQKVAGDRMVNSSVAGSSDVAAYAFSYSSKQVSVILVNKGTTTQTASIGFQNFTPGSRFYWYTLTGGGDNGSFSRKVLVNGQGPTGVSGGPLNYPSIKANSATTQNGVRVSLPGYSAVYLIIDK